MEKPKLTTDEIVHIKTNAKVAKLVLSHKVNPIHFNLLKSTITKIENMSGIETSVPSDYKNKSET